MRRLLKWWAVLGEILGDGDYARYCAFLERKRPGQAPPTAAEFYLCRLRERYSRPNRCC